MSPGRFIQNNRLAASPALLNVCRYTYLCAWEHYLYKIPTIQRQFSVLLNQLCVARDRQPLIHLGGGSSGLS